MDKQRWREFLLLVLFCVGLLCGVEADPMLLPNVSSCSPQFSRKFSSQVDCCLLLSYPVPITKRLSDVIGKNKVRKKLRVRQPAHLLDEEAAEKLNRAYALAKALPPQDPRSWAAQARLHCFYSYQNMRYQAGFPDAEYNIHLNWLFHPFHRMLTYFHERILGSLLGDEELALPFWNWDNQLPTEGPLPNAIPPIFQDPVKYPALYDVYRGPSENQIADLAAGSTFAVPYKNDDELRVINNDLLHRILVEKSEADPVLFFSTPIRAGESGSKKDRLDNNLEEFESVIHGAVHTWTGSDETGRDMGAAWTAADDPIFYAHHANVDRIWKVWKTLDGNRMDIDDPDWLDSEFFFYDEHAELVLVKVREALDIEALGYTYADVENPWIAPPASFPTSLSTVSPLSSITS